MYSVKRRLASFCFSFLGLWNIGAACAQTIYLDITNPNFQKIPIAVPDFKYMSSDQTQLARQMAECSQTILISRGFPILDPKGFLEDPQKMGLDASQINFPRLETIWAQTFWPAAPTRSRAIR